MSFFSKSIINQLVLVSLIVAALGFRFFRITSNDFIFYDEGMYLNYNLPLLKLISHNPPKNIQEFGIILSLIYKNILATPKALWFFLVNCRVFITGVDGLYFSRILSAICGVLTIGLVWQWARKYYDCRQTALLSALILAFLPSHVFYSRQGMQEALSTLLFLSGTYVFLFSKRGAVIGAGVSALLMFAVFLTNYRMIVAPAFIFLYALWRVITKTERWDIPKIMVFAIVYLLGFLLIGILEGGINLKANIAWMANQAGESGNYHQWYNFFSFPYYLFDLENIAFGFLFVFSFFISIKYERKDIYPSLVVLFQMLIFSVAAEKGARYLCVVFPFAAMAVANTLVQIYRQSMRLGLLLIVLMFLLFIATDFKLCNSKTGYKAAVELIKAHDPAAKIISTQPVIERLFVPAEDDIMPLPKTIEETAMLVKRGYRYLIIDPQLYISWTANGKRFSVYEIDFIAKLRQQAYLVARLPHFNEMTLKRFVLDHNQDLRTSVQFLKNAANKEDIFIYDLGF